MLDLGLIIFSNKIVSQLHFELDSFIAFLSRKVFWLCEKGDWLFLLGFLGPNPLFSTVQVDLFSELSVDVLVLCETLDNSSLMETTDKLLLVVSSLDIDELAPGVKLSSCFECSDC